jgi:hypothetical protein
VLRPDGSHDGAVTKLHEFEAIDWHLFLNTPEVRKAEKIVGRLEMLIGEETETLSLEGYWKDPTVIDARLRSSFGPIADPAEALYEFMLTIKRLARTFSTAGPQIYEGGAVEFVALADAGFVEAGVSWMEASICNFEPPDS